MENVSASYNNAGVRILETRGGNVGIALELFRAALESMRATQRRELNQDMVMESTQEDQDSMVLANDNHGAAQEEMSDCLRRAEMHLQNLGEYLTPVPDQPSLVEQGSAFPSTTPQLAPSHHNGHHINVLIVPVQSRGYDPYICARPFLLTDTTLVASHVRSSMIVYNLGLAHQLLNRVSMIAADFYELSASMVSSLPITSDSLLLRLSLLNNLGVWSFETGDGESMCTCMEHAALLLDTVERETTAGTANTDHAGNEIDPELLAGVRTNIQELLSPSHGGSPAA